MGEEVGHDTENIYAKSKQKLLFSLKLWNEEFMKDLLLKTETGRLCNTAVNKMNFSNVKLGI